MEDPVTTVKYQTSTLMAQRSAKDRFRPPSEQNVAKRDDYFVTNQRDATQAENEISTLRVLF